MKRLLIAARPVAVILVTGMLYASAQGKPENGRQVTVYFHDQANTTGDLMKTQARRQASDMFASIGVTLHWRTGSPAGSESGVIAIEFVTDTPDTLLPGGLAYALPYEGVHIRIFWDRIRAAGPYPRQLLAHVMVHEITHILQGSNGHSDEGIMKAHWSQRDKSDMQARPLHFSQPDLLLIYQGMDARAAHGPKPTAGVMTAGGGEIRGPVIGMERYLAAVSDELVLAVSHAIAARARSEPIMNAPVTLAWPRSGPRNAVP